MFVRLDEAASYILYQLDAMASFARFLRGEQINRILLHLRARGSRREFRLLLRLALERLAALRARSPRCCERREMR